MTEYGYFLSSEELSPWSMIESARYAESIGMDSLFISDHFHPWLESQGESPFVWGVLAAIAASIDQPLMTGVTCLPDVPHPSGNQVGAQLVTEEDVAKSIPCGPDPAVRAEAISKYVDAGYDEIFIAQVGDDQRGFFDFFSEELRPVLP